MKERNINKETHGERATRRREKDIYVSRNNNINERERERYKENPKRIE
jgi:hypothetical protein